MQLLMKCSSSNAAISVEGIGATNNIGQLNHFQLTALLIPSPAYPCSSKWTQNLHTGCYSHPFTPHALPSPTKRMAIPSSRVHFTTSAFPPFTTHALLPMPSHCVHTESFTPHGVSTSLHSACRSHPCTPNDQPIPSPRMYATQTRTYDTTVVDFQASASTVGI